MRCIRVRFLHKPAESDPDGSPARFRVSCKISSSDPPSMIEPTSGSGAKAIARETPSAFDTRHVGCRQLSCSEIPWTMVMWDTWEHTEHSFYTLRVILLLYFEFELSPMQLCPGAKALWTRGGAVVGRSEPECFELCRTPSGPEVSRNVRMRPTPGPLRLS